MSITRAAAGRLGGQVRSEAKARQARLNGLRGGMKLRPLAEIPCNCGATEVTTGHKSTCLRGRAIKRRLARGQPLV